METWQAILLAIVEGLTEYLPISSTGHMILVSNLFGIESSDFTKDYIIIIQFGAILAAAVYYHKRLLSGRQIYKQVLCAFIPTALIGFALKNKIDALLESTLMVGFTTLLGGVILLVCDRWFKNPSVKNLKQLKVKTSFFVGLFQSIAMIPGVSRSAASILGGQALGLSRASAAEFSFLLAIPTLTAAAAYKCLKLYMSYYTSNPIRFHWTQIAYGNLISFVIGLITIKFFIEFLNRKGFFWFGVYRILLGLAILYWSLGPTI